MQTPPTPLAKKNPDHPRRLSYALTEELEEERERVAQVMIEDAEERDLERFLLIQGRLL